MPMDGRDPISLLSLQPGVLYLGQSVSLGDKTTPNNMDSRQGRYRAPAPIRAT